MKPPHASRDPRYYPPEKPEDETLADLALGIAAIVLIAIVFFVFLPVLT